MNSRQHMLFALLLGVIGLLILLVFVNLRSQADSPSTSVGLDNTAPSMANFAVGSSTDTPVESSTSDSQALTADITELDGYANIDGGTVNVYYGLATGVAGNSCTSDPATCKIAAITLSGGTGADSGWE